MQPKIKLDQVQMKAIVWLKKKTRLQDEMKGFINIY